MTLPKMNDMSLLDKLWRTVVAWEDGSEHRLFQPTWDEDGNVIDIELAALFKQSVIRDQENYREIRYRKQP